MRWPEETEMKCVCYSWLQYNNSTAPHRAAPRQPTHPHAQLLSPSPPRVPRHPHTYHTGRKETRYSSLPVTLRLPTRLPQMSSI
ncbi:hypothetical protein E2C01_044161 [Portunus trituberculatus]|uniref:Uncharacterized protein n=1 Tax=Portunus trituberculatus TaxID=210409 RepID=A0A5B7FZ78_PORTR|nr:hypothetical protein [Portunus trituberculatus]